MMVPGKAKRDALNFWNTNGLGSIPVDHVSTYIDNVVYAFQNSGSDVIEKELHCSFKSNYFSERYARIYHPSKKIKSLIRYHFDRAAKMANQNKFKF